MEFNFKDAVKLVLSIAKDQLVGIQTLKWLLFLNDHKKKLMKVKSLSNLKAKNHNFPSKFYI
jgi:hypothetical protein